MKKYFFAFLVINFLLVFQSCSNEDSSFVKNTRIIDESSNLRFVNDTIEYLDFEQFTELANNIISIKTSNMSESEKIDRIEESSRPLINIGKKVMNHITSTVDIRDEYYELSEEEMFIIHNLNAIDYANIGIILNLNNIQTNNWNQDQVLDCISVGLGIEGIVEIFKNTKSLAAFGETKTTKDLLKLAGKLGRRFLGWVGVALFVRDFGNCMGAW